jgi:HEAT repeat protein
MPPTPGVNGPLTKTPNSAKSNPAKPKAPTTPPDNPPPVPAPETPATPKPVPPGSTVPPGLRKPGSTTPPADPRPDRPPTTPPATPTPPPTPPKDAPPKGPKGPKPEAPPHGQARTPRSGTRGGAGSGSGWTYWWTFNREHLLGFRRKMSASGPVSGTKTVAKDPAEVRRDLVRVALRRVATSKGEPTLRASALIALGRAGRGDDAPLFLRVLQEKNVDAIVQEGAALGLGMLPPIESKQTRELVREHLNYYLRVPTALPTRARAFAVIATGLRARDDRVLVMQLASELASPQGEQDRFASVMLAGGLSGDRMVAPELVQAARRGRVGSTVQMPDPLRAHAACALAHLGDPVAVPTLSALLRSRRGGPESKRAAALGLGRLLRETRLPAADRKQATDALAKVLDKPGDSNLRGFAALGLGGAKPPARIPELKRLLDSGGDAMLRPYVAISLGLAARTMGSVKGKPIAAFLAGELAKSKSHDLHGALCIALGLARARDAHDSLIDRVESSRLPAQIRGYAAQALALCGKKSPRATRALEQIVAEGPSDLIGDAAIALGMLGRRRVALDLLKQLKTTQSRATQARIVLALGHIAHEQTTAPLLDLVARKDRPQLREFALVALGLMHDTRKADPLFTIEADFNFFATMDSTRELLRLY